MNASTFNLTLRPYQEETATKINDIYNSDSEYNRFAGVVLPTGGGKSFVAIDQMISINNSNGESSNEKEGIINNSNIVYVAPSKAILSQVMLHILRNVILNHMDENAKNKEIGKLSPAQIEKRVKKAFPNLVFKCYAGIKEKDTTEDEKSKEEYDSVEKNMQVNESDIADADLVIIDEAHRVGAKSWGQEMKTAIGNNKKCKVLAITATPERKEPKNKRDMMYGIAKMVYTEKTPSQEKYMAQEMYLLDAMRDGIVTTPEVVEFSSSLADSDEYKELLNLLESFEKEGRSGTEKDKVINAIKKMNEIIGYDPKEISPEEKEEKRKADVRKTIAENIENKNGKYIAFIPKNNTNEKNKEKYFEEWEKKIRDDLGDVDAENITVKYIYSGKNKKNSNDNMTVDETLKWFQDEPNDKGGIKILISVDMLDEGVHVDEIDGEFMYKPVKSSRVYLQESGRCISSCNPDLPSEKQKKRKIFDMVGNTRRQVQMQTGKKTSHQYDLNKIYEITEWIESNNGIIPDINKETTDELTDKEKVSYEKEIRYAIALRNMKFKYQWYLGKEISNENEKIIQEILNKANEIDLWNMEIPERKKEIKPSEEQLTGGEFLEYSDKEKEFMDAYHKAEYAGGYKEKHGINKYKFNRIINILKVLKKYNPDIEIPDNGIIYYNNGKINTTKTLNSVRNKRDKEGKFAYDFENFLKNNFSETDIVRIYKDLQNYDLLDASNYRELYYEGNQINLVDELAWARGYFWTCGKNVRFLGTTLKEVIDLGLIDITNKRQREDIRDMFGVDVDELFDDKGFIKERTGYSVYTDAKASEKLCVASDTEMGSFTQKGRTYNKEGYNRYGYDKDGYDEFGFDEFGFNRKKIHRDTVSRYDVRGFYWDEKQSQWLNRETNTEYDLLGYNIYGKNEDGFERPGEPPYVKTMCYKRYEDGTYDKNSESQYSESRPSKNSLGFTKAEEKSGALIGSFDSDGVFYEHGRKYDTGIKKYYNFMGLDANGYNEAGFKKVEVDGKEKYIHRDTSTVFNPKGQIWHVEKGKRFFEGKLKLNPIFQNCQYILRKMINENKSVDEVCEDIMAKRNYQDKESTLDSMKNSCKRAIYLSKYATEFDLYTDKNGRSIFLDINKYPDKLARINEFFELCPEAKKYLVVETKEIKARIDGKQESKEMKKIKRQQNIKDNLKELEDFLEL